MPLGLCSCHLAFRHPVTGKKMEFQAALGEAFTGFQTLWKTGNHNRFSL